MNLFPSRAWAVVAMLLLAADCAKSSQEAPASADLAARLSLVATYQSFLATTTSSEREQLLAAALKTPVGNVTQILESNPLTANAFASFLSTVAPAQAAGTTLGAVLTEFRLPSPTLLDLPDFRAAVLAAAPMEATLDGADSLGLVYLDPLLPYSKTLCSDLGSTYEAESPPKWTVSAMVSFYTQNPVSPTAPATSLRKGPNIATRQAAAAKGRGSIFTVTDMRSYFWYCQGTPLPGDTNYNYEPFASTRGAGVTSATDDASSAGADPNSGTGSCQTAEPGSSDDTGPVQPQSNGSPAGTWYVFNPTGGYGGCGGVPDT